MKQEGLAKYPNILNNTGMYKIDRKWLIVLFLIFIFFISVFCLLQDKYHSIGDAKVYDTSAEIYKRLLFRGDIDTIYEYAKVNFGSDQVEFLFVTNGEKPLYFLFLAIIKSFTELTIGSLFFVNMMLLTFSLFLMSNVLQPRNKKIFVLLGALLLSPFIITQAINLQPHIFQVFLISIGIFFYNKKCYYKGFLFITFSLFAHPSSMILAISLWFYHIYTFRKDWGGYIGALLGSITACLIFSSVEFILFIKDKNLLFPHTYQVENLFFFKGRAGSLVYRVYDVKVGGVYGNLFAPGFLNFWKNSLVQLPLATIGLFWLRNKFQFAITLLPVMLFLVMTKFNLPNHRAFMPIYFFAYCFFIYNYLSAQSKLIKKICVGLFFLAICHSALYLIHTSHSISICDKANVSIQQPPEGYSGGADYSNLYWNLKRFNTLTDDASITYKVVKHSLVQHSNIPYPQNFYPYLLTKIITKFVAPESIGIDTRSTDQYSLEKIKKPL